MRSIILLIVAVFFTLASAATKTCQATSGVRDSLCNATYNAYAIPAKVCAFGPVDVAITACIDQVFNTWQLKCPKRNLDLTSFCQGWGGYENIDYTYSCLVLHKCDADEDCKDVAPPPASDKKKCYECCDLCYENCADISGGQYDEYAAQGNSECTACPYTATPHTLPPIPTNIPALAPAAPPSASGTTPSSSSPSGNNTPTLNQTSSGWIVTPIAVTAAFVSQFLVLAF